MSNEDKRRRRDGSTAQLSVAELLARREAETQPIPVYRDDAEDTVRFKAVTPSPLSGRELHIAELLRREGRPADEERGGMSISRLVAIASGGVVLCGSVAFGASQWLSSPDERPLADVRFDDRPAARNSSNSGDLGAVAMREAQPGTNTPAAGTTTPTQQQQQAPGTQAPGTQTPGTQTPGTSSSTGTSTSDPTSQSPTPGKSTTAPPSSSNTQAPPSSSSPTPPSSTTPPPSSSTPPPSSSTPTPPPSSTAPDSGGLLGLGVGVGLGLGGFDFFAAL